MWIVILNFCLFLFLLGIFLYGLKYWNSLISEPEEDEADNIEIETFYYRLPFYIIVSACGIYSIIAGFTALW
ncbi:MAG: hypothetical protein ACQETH_02435 [Candidatus Rifleibacteriota bacterium]